MPVENINSRPVESKSRVAKSAFRSDLSVSDLRLCRDQSTPKGDPEGRNRSTKDWDDGILLINRLIERMADEREVGNLGSEIFASFL